MTATIEAPSVTAMAATFARAMAARKIDVKLAHKASDSDARAVFTDVRWADMDGRPHCIYCGAEKPYVVSSRPGWYRCRFNKCHRHFSITSKTVFASHKMPLQGCLVALGSVVDDAGLRPVQLAEATGTTYRAAWVLGKKLGLYSREDRPRGELLSYPYRAKPLKGDDYDLLMAINAAVPRGFPPEMREDVCQEAALAILCGDFDKSDVAGAVRAAKAKYNRIFRGKFGDLSLDAPLSHDGGATFLDMIDSEREHW